MSFGGKIESDPTVDGSLKLFGVHSFTEMNALPFWTLGGVGPRKRSADASGVNWKLAYLSLACKVLLHSPLHFTSELLA